jgi:hypothetical protein
MFPWKYKKGGNKKERYFLQKGRRRFLYSCVLLRFGNNLRLTPSSAPPSREHAHTGTSLTTFRPMKTSRGYTTIRRFFDTIAM